MNGEIKEYWSRRLMEKNEVSYGKSEKLDRYRIELILNVLKTMIKTFETGEIGNLLDFGCGLGRFIPFINEIIPGSFINYVGVDIVDEIIERNNKLYEKDPHINFFTIQDDIISREKKFNNYFNSIFSITVLQHILDKEILVNYIKQFWNLLEFGGYVFITENIWDSILIGDENENLISEETEKEMKRYEEKEEKKEEEKEKEEKKKFIVFRNSNFYRDLFERENFKFVDANIVSLVPIKELHYLALFKKVEKIEVNIEEVKK